METVGASGSWQFYFSYARDHSVAESFAYLNALQPGIFSPDDITRAVLAQKAGAAAAAFDDLPPLKPALG